MSVKYKKYLSIFYWKELIKSRFANQAFNIKRATNSGENDGENGTLINVTNNPNALAPAEVRIVNDFLVFFAQAQQSYAKIRHLFKHKIDGLSETIDAFIKRTNDLQPKFNKLQTALETLRQSCRENGHEHPSKISAFIVALIFAAFDYAFLSASTAELADSVGGVGMLTIGIVAILLGLCELTGHSLAKPFIVKSTKDIPQNETAKIKLDFYNITVFTILVVISFLFILAVAAIRNLTTGDGTPHVSFELNSLGVAFFIIQTALFIVGTLWASYRYKPEEVLCLKNQKKLQRDIIPLKKEINDLDSKKSELERNRRDFQAEYDTQGSLVKIAVNQTRASAFRAIAAYRDAYLLAKQSKDTPKSFLTNPSLPTVKDLELMDYSTFHDIPDPQDFGGVAEEII